MFHRLLCVCVLTCLGCGGKPSDAPQLAKVTGKVTLDQKPLSAGIISFIPDGERGTKGPPAMGGIGADGTFELHTSQPGDGATVGFHRVSIEAYEPPPPFDPQNPQMVKPKPRIAKKYFDVSTSGLTAEVKSGEKNTFSFELQP